MSEKYITVAKTASAEITEKKSRFIANVKPVKTEEEALEFLSVMRKKYSDARHNVYAYCLRENSVARYSDDGEPAQTAGLPVIDMIKKAGLTDLIVVVTRYFGGILLGTGGLVRAYTKAAKEGIIASDPVEMALCKEVTIECDYTMLGKIQSKIAELGFLCDEPVYTEKVLIFLYIPEDETENFIKLMTDFTNGKASISTGETKFQPKIVNIV